MKSFYDPVDNCYREADDFYVEQFKMSMIDAKKKVDAGADKALIFDPVLRGYKEVTDLIVKEYFQKVK